MLSLVIPSRNNKKYVQFAYESIRNYLGNKIEVILLDDASTDGTWEWMLTRKQFDFNTKIYRNEGPERVGHTVLYDKGAELATNDIFGIFHADMVASPNYLTNMVKHLKKGTVVSATRVEPPLHPPGKEKHTIDFGLEPENFLTDRFLEFVHSIEESTEFKDQTTEGIFAPWIIHKEDFFAIGGHDKRVFAPMELEDSDLFNRFKLAGYKFIQARDSLVYHMTCRGSRFKDGVKIIQEIPLSGGHVWKRPQDSDEYTALRQNKFREWWRKWHMNVLHDDQMRPIVWPRYDVGFIIKNCSKDMLSHLEPWCDTIYIEDKKLIEEYTRSEQSTSKFKIAPRIRHFSDSKNNDILISFDASHFTQQNFTNLLQIPLLIQDSGEVGFMEFDIFTLEIRIIRSLNKNLINADDPWYINQLYGNNTN